MARIETSLDLFHKAGGIVPIRQRNVQMSDYLLRELDQIPNLKRLSPMKE